MCPESLSPRACTSQFVALEGPLHRPLRGGRLGVCQLTCGVNFLRGVGRVRVPDNTGGGGESSEVGWRRERRPALGEPGCAAAWPWCTTHTASVPTTRCWCRGPPARVVLWGCGWDGTCGSELGGTKIVSIFRCFFYQLFHPPSIYHSIGHEAIKSAKKNNFSRKNQMPERILFLPGDSF